MINDFEYNKSDFNQLKINSQTYLKFFSPNEPFLFLGPFFLSLLVSFKSMVLIHILYLIYDLLWIDTNVPLLKEFWIFVSCVNLILDLIDIRF